jgi:hypothetical protein
MREKLSGNCRTTAMGIMPHTDIDRALKLAMSFDIPFWPQLPHVSIYEDMYVQLSEHMPGLSIDEADKRVDFVLPQFYEDLPAYFENAGDPGYFRLSPRYSLVFESFLKQDLAGYYAIRGQSIGPISFGLKITDEDKKPIIYNDDVRQVLYDFIARKITAQQQEMAEHHPRAFVWLDEPGLQFIFTAYTGYASERASQDYAAFLEQLPYPKGVHLCGNPDWSFLLDLDLDILSVDTLVWGDIFTRYTGELRRFLDRGGIISWGITPTLDEDVADVTVNAMLNKLEKMWDFLASRGIPKEQILAQAWLAPARCCLVNRDETGVERSFTILQEVANTLQERYRLEVRGSQ